MSARHAVWWALVVLALAAAGCRTPRRSASLPGAAAADAGADAAFADAPPADDAMPPPESEELTTRVKHLLEAIAHDDPQLAADIEFPRDAWVATRGGSDPGREWEKRVAVPFRRAVHRASRQKRGSGRAEFVSLQIGRGMTPLAAGKHGWQKPLWSVRDARITFVVDGHTRTLVIHEMTSWRGAFYVVRL